MEPRVETAYLLDFYGALLTPKRREMLRMRYEEDNPSPRSARRWAFPARR